MPGSSLPQVPAEKVSELVEETPLQKAFATFLEEQATLDLKVLQRHWQAAPRRHGALPLYEDAVLGRTGRAAANTALVRPLSGGRYEIASRVRRSTIGLISKLLDGIYRRSHPIAPMPFSMQLRRRCGRDTQFTCGLFPSAMAS